MPNLLMYRVRASDEELLFPHQQNPIARIELDDHIGACPSCVQTTTFIFDGCGTRNIAVLRCDDGIALLRRLESLK